MGTVRRYLALYAVAGATVLCLGLADLVGPGGATDDRVAAALFVLAGVSILAATTAGLRRPVEDPAEEPPAWAAAASVVGVLSAAAGIAVRLA